MQSLKDWGQKLASDWQAAAKDLEEWRKKTRDSPLFWYLVILIVIADIVYLVFLRGKITFLFVAGWIFVLMAILLRVTRKKKVD